MIKLIIFDWGRTLYDNDHERLFPDTISVLMKMSNNYQLAIVSLAVDGNFEKRWEALKKNDLLKYFVSVYFTQDKDAAYEKTLTQLSLRPDEVLIVDDRVVRGINWANKHG